MIDEQIGPENRVIQAQSYKSCSGCIFHESKIWVSGRDPKYHHFCKHGDVPGFAKSIFRPSTGFIGDDDITPDWCPVEKEKK